MIRPEIIIKAYKPNETALKEILAGIEEEGVLYKVVIEMVTESEAYLGQTASQMSQLEVGIGVSENAASLFIHKIKDRPLFTTWFKYRELGQNAARYVKGNPLIEI